MIWIPSSLTPQKKERIKMSNIQIPGNKGIPISPYPKIKYEQSFICASDGCSEISRFFIEISLIPNNTSLIQMNG
ncbi:hypothetical protein LCGC14_2227950, partial [marine sediment metagenome]